MQPLKISKTHSINSSRVKRWGIILGLIIFFLGTLSLIAPILLRSDRGTIQKRLDSIAALPEGQQGRELQRITTATAHSESASRALAAWYAKQNDPTAAAQAYEQSRPALLLEAAEQYAAALDYESVARIAQKAVNKRPSATGLGWLSLATLNRGDTDRGCAYAQDAIALDSHDNTATNAQAGCSLLRAGDQDLTKRFSAGLYRLVEQEIESYQKPSSSELNLLAELKFRQKSDSAGLDALAQAVRQTPFDRTTLQNIISACEPGLIVEVCTTLKPQAEATLRQLPPY